jgi:thiol:disulfide interchange protein DsbD
MTSATARPIDPLRPVRAWLLFWLLLFSPWVAAQGGWSLPGRSTTPTAVAQSEYSRVELLAHAPEGVAPGRPLWLGLRIEHAPEWHTYWKNPGDSGLPIELEWTLPDGLQPGEVQWPTPRKFPIGELANYGYDGTLLLPVPVTVSRLADGPTLTVQVRATWLICRRECVPEEAQLQLQIPTDRPLTEHAAAFEAALAAVPRSIEGRGELRVEGERLRLLVAGLPPAWRGQRLEFFPETGNLIAPGAPWEQRWDGDTWHASVPLTPYRSEAPDRLAFVLAPPAPQPHGLAAAGVRLDWPVAGRWPPVAPAPAATPALPTPVPANPPPSSLGFAVALLGALVGGMVLNLMPCVFPVLAIKVMAFQSHGSDARAHRLGGLAYTAGVVLSFLALGAVLLGLRTAGEAVGWGFQLQNPWVVAGLATLFTLIGLNLAGVFELGQLAPSGLAGLQLRHPLADAFLTGVLATAIASPCTAPFMGASLGLAVTLPAAQALSVFAALGLGMALPYLAASFWPALARRLPRPGPWMETFRRAMAFPMFATVVWLLWVLGQQSGIDGAAALLALLVALAFALWAWSLRGRARWVLGSVAVALLGWLGTVWGPRVGQLIPANVASDGTTAAADEALAGDLVWQPWSPEAVERLLARGQPVFVDFTAAWCVTCQVNKKTTLSHPDVLADMRAKGVQLLRADWTRYDPVITAELARLGRTGVPVYVLLAPGRAPRVLSELLSVREVREALATL